MKMRPDQRKSIVADFDKTSLAGSHKVTPLYQPQPPHISDPNVKCLPNVEDTTAACSTSYATTELSVSETQELKLFL